MDRELAARLRAEMVERQLRSRDIRDETVLAAMAAIPRERFVPAELEADAYSDEALAIPAGQTISQPYIVARMTELGRPREGMAVLEVGTGSGYQAAILAYAGCAVTSVERYPQLASAAVERLAALGLDERVRVVVGDGTLGWPERAPYEAILVTAAAPRVPDALRGQLAEGGRLVIPVGPRDHQELLVVTRRGDGFDERSAGPCVFVPLIGEQGYRESPQDAGASGQDARGGSRRWL